MEKKYKGDPQTLLIVNALSSLTSGHLLNIPY